MPTAAAALERASKGAVATSAVLLVALLLGAHPDLTTLLRAAGVSAAVLGFFTARRYRQWAVAAWLALAPLCPALLYALTGREGTSLDLVWMAGLTGALVRLTSWTRWHLPWAWRVPLGAWGLGLALAWPALLGRETAFNVAGLTDPYTVNTMAGLSAAYVTSWILFVALTAVLGLLWLDWLMAGEAHHGAGHNPAVRALWFGITAASMVALVQGRISIGFLSTPAWAALRRATGTMLDANGYGAAAAIAGPMALAVLWNGDRPWHRPAAVAALAVNITGLWMSGSRTALLCGIAGVIGVAIALRPRGVRVSARSLGIAVAVLALAAVVVSASDAVGPLERLRETPLSRSGLRSLWDRGGYGVIAMQMLRQYPWTGVGTGAYHVLAPDYWRAVSDLALPFDNAQNWWRHQLAELGVPLALVLFAWSAVLLRDLVRRGPEAGRTERRVAAALLAGIGLSSLVGVPTQNPVVLLGFGALCAILAGARPPEPVATPRWTGPASAAALAAALVYAGGHALLASGDLSAPARALRADRDYIVGASFPEPIADFDEFRWTGRRADFVLRRADPWLATRVWVAHPDMGGNPVRVTVATPCQVLLDERLQTVDPVELALHLPDGVDAVHLIVRASRTWTPADHGSIDDRRLGAGVALKFRPDRQAVPAAARIVEIQACS